MVHRSSPAPFLLKTYELVDDPTTADVISWNDMGTGFVVWKTADFAKDLLPNSFKHSNFSSFVRQLNTYGFHKIVPDKWEFANQYFMRGRKELLIEIHRRKAVTPLKGDGDHGSSSTSSHDGSKSHGLVDAHKFENLFEENEKLKKEKECLKLEIAQAKKQCDDLMAFVSQHVKPVPDQLNRGSDGDMDVTGKEPDGKNDGGDIDGECVRLFGVFLKDERKKRGCYVNNNETSGTRMKNMKLQGEFNNEIPWMNRACSVTKYI